MYMILVQCVPSFSRNAEFKRFVNHSSSLELKLHEVKTASFAWSIGSWATSYCDVDMHTIFFVKTGAAPGVRFHPSLRERHLLHSVAHPWDQACSILRGNSL